MNIATSHPPSTSVKLDFIWLELTAKCNLHCVHCYAGSHPRLPLEAGMGRSDWESVLNQARALSCRHVQFIGGEVLLVPYLSDLIARARSLGFDRIEVFTNATLLTDELLDCFTEHRVEVATSFYCSRPEIHDRVTQRRDSWNKTVSAIERVQARQLPLRVGIIEMDINHHYMQETIQFLRELGISRVGVDRARSIGRAVQLTGTDESLGQLCGRCGHGRVCVTSTGEVHPCIMARQTVLGSVLDQALSEAISSCQLSDFRRALGEAKSAGVRNACTPDCFPNGGCSPHDICKPSDTPCSPDCNPNGGCAPDDVCKPNE